MKNSIERENKGKEIHNTREWEKKTTAEESLEKNKCTSEKEPDETREKLIADIMCAIERASNWELRLIRASAYGATGLI